MRWYGRGGWHAFVVASTDRDDSGGAIRDAAGQHLAWPLAATPAAPPLAKPSGTRTQPIRTVIDIRTFDGGRDTLRQAVACMVEVHLSRHSAGQTTFGELIQLMANANLHYVSNTHQSIRRTGTVCYVDAVFMRQEVLWQAPPSQA